MSDLNNTGTTSRIQFIDIAKAIGIFLVVSYHQNAIMGYYLNLFFMPLFFMMSGIFFTVRREPGQFVANMCRRLLRPLVIGFVLGAVLEVFVYDFENARISIDASFYNFLLVGNAPLWFLVSLSWTMLCTYVVERRVGSTRAKVCIYVALSLAGYALSMAHMRNTLFVGQALLVYPFFVLGYKTKAYWLSRRWYDCRVCVPALALLYVIIRYLEPHTNIHQLVISAYYLDSMLAALCFIILIFTVSQMLSGSRIAGILGWIGRSTIYVLALHYLLIKPTDYIVGQLIDVESLRWSAMVGVLMAECAVICVMSILIGMGIKATGSRIDTTIRRALAKATE